MYIYIYIALGCWFVEFQAACSKMSTRSPGEEPKSRAACFGRGVDTVGNPHRAQMSQF